MNVNELLPAVREIEQVKGPFKLFALVLRSDSPSGWDLLVSAPWIEKGKLRGLSNFVNLLAAQIGKHGVGGFARIATLGAQDEAMRDLLRVSRTSERIGHPMKLNGIQVDDAIILRPSLPADRVLVSAARYP